MDSVIIFLMLLFNPKWTIRFYCTLAIILGIGLVFSEGFEFDYSLLICFPFALILAIVIIFLPEHQKAQKLKREQQIRELILKREQQQKIQEQQSNKK